ncbi:MAG: response regulator transcription factor [Deltaproteobacteria bacterium]|nr:response regulator transcription factor [Deltaproteobacteria bacterium]
MAVVLVIEDDKALGEQIETVLKEAGYEVTWKPDGLLGLKAVKEIEPDMVVLDIMLPKMDGFAVLSRIRDFSSVPVIILTALSEGEDKVRGLDLGADDYLTKPFWMEELLARIRARLRRPNLAQDENIFSFGDVVVEPDARRVEVHGKPAELTRVEFDLLLYLLQRPGRAITREHLVEAALEPEKEGTYRTLDTHFSRIRKKLGSSGGYIKTVWGIGYRFVPDQGDDRQ